MADFTLSDGDNYTVSSNTTVSDFYYEGGKIDVQPKARFVREGYFNFTPTSSADSIGHIYGALVALVETETGVNGTFANFKVYDAYPENTALFFPCIVFALIEQEEPIREYMFKGEFMETNNIVCDLAFKKTDFKTVGGILLSGSDLADYYLTNMREKLRDVVFKSDAIKVGSFIEKSSLQKPKEPNQTLYGFSMEIMVDFKNMSAD